MCKIKLMQLCMYTGNLQDVPCVQNTRVLTLHRSWIAQTFF